MEKLIQGRIIEAERDSQNTLHIHFRKGLHTYRLWAVDNIADVLEKYDNEHGAYYEVAAKPIQLRFSDVTGEINEIIFVDHSV